MMNGDASSRMLTNSVLCGREREIEIERKRGRGKEGERVQINISLCFFVLESYITITTLFNYDFTLLYFEKRQSSKSLVILHAKTLPLLKVR